MRGRSGGGLVGRLLLPRVSVARAARRVSPLSKVSKAEQLRRGQAAGGPSLVRPGPELQQFTCAVGPRPFQARGPCQLRRAPC